MAADEIWSRKLSLAHLLPLVSEVLLVLTMDLLYR
jgi:hypothetical protein